MGLMQIKQLLGRQSRCYSSSASFHHPSPIPVSWPHGPLHCLPIFSLSSYQLVNLTVFKKKHENEPKRNRAAAGHSLQQQAPRAVQPYHQTIPFFGMFRITPNWALAPQEVPCGASGHGSCGTFHRSTRWWGHPISRPCTKPVRALAIENRHHESLPLYPRSGGSAGSHRYFFRLPTSHPLEIIQMRLQSEKLQVE